MFKKILIISTLFFILSVCAMEKTKLALWVKATSHITVTTVHTHINVAIKNDTTILDIKNILQEHNSPGALHMIRAIWLRPETCFLLTGRSEWLRNDQRVKQIMNIYQTDQFELHVQQKRKLK